MEISCYIPIHIEKYYIYDIFYNDRGHIVVIHPSENAPNTISMYNNSQILNFQVEMCPHNHTRIYYLCDARFLLKENENVDLIINDEKINTKINKYPTFDNEIIMSTLVKNEDKYIIQWINYHTHLGISRFIIYDNSTSNTLQVTLNKYINNNVVILIKWTYNYYLPISGISGQTTQQNHSIYAFNKCKFIGLFDIDEYINLQKPQ